jgi:hypothetical protein
MCIHEKKFVPKLQPKKLKFERRGVCGGRGSNVHVENLKKEKNPLKVSKLGPEVLFNKKRILPH